LVPKPSSNPLLVVSFRAQCALENMIFTQAL
jgi:hypothetical protein